MLVDQPRTVCSLDGQPSAVSFLWAINLDRRSGSEGASGRAKVSIIMGTAYAQQSAGGACSKPIVMKS